MRNAVAIDGWWGEKTDIEWGIGLACLMFLVIEHLLCDVSIAHSIGLFLTLLGYAAAVALNGRMRHPVSIAALFKNNLGLALGESLLAALILVALASAAKVIYVHSVPGSSFFELHRLDSSYLAYLWVAPVQEISVRGILQSHLARAIRTRKAELHAILASCSIFALLHAFHSVTFALASFAFGALCGVLFLRHRNLIGISLFHIVFGNFVGVIGIWDLLANAA